jgi:hypothetical protein
MRNKNNHGALNFIVSITLFTVFALTLTLVLLTGASAFRGVSVNAEERFNERTPLLYVSNRLRDSETVRITEHDGVPVLVVDDIEGFFDIYIYLYDGQIREFYSFRGEPPFLEYGVVLFPAESLDFAEVMPSLVRVTINGRDLFVNTEVVA